LGEWDHRDLGAALPLHVAEGDIYRLLSRTLEYLSQVHSLQATHPDLATVAAEALSRIRRGVLEELP